MIEGLVGLVELFVSAIAALVSAVVQLLSAILESLGFAATTLVTSPSAGERRFSTRRLAKAFAPLVFLLLMIPALFWFVSWRAEVNRTKRRETVAIVSKTAEDLAKVGDNGRFQRQEDFVALDTWGRKLILEYSESDLTETLLVRSLGLDGTQRTIDDIVEKRRNVLPIVDVAHALTRRVKDGLEKSAK